MAPHLFGNQADASWAWGGDFDSGHTRGSKFRVTVADGAISAVGFYRAGTGVTFTKLMLFHEDTTLLWSSTAPVDDVTFGWKWTPVDPPIAVTTGVSYYVTANFQGSQSWSTNTTPASRASPPAEFIFDDLPHWWAGGVNECPTYASTANFFSLSVELGEAPEPTPGPGEGDPTTTGDLNSWLSADVDVQTHETDGLPWLTKVAVDASRAVIDGLAEAVGNIGDAIGDVADAASATGSLMARVAEILARIPANILNSIKLTGEWLLSWFGTGARPEGAPTIPDALDQLLSAQEDQAAQLETLWHRTETSNWLVSVPGSDWVLQDTLEWDAPFSWNQPADCYVVHLTAIPTYVTAEDVAGTAYYPKAAWWAPLTGTLPHERHYCEFEFQVLHQLPMRCEGILFRPRNNFAGTIEAWTRPEATP